MVSCSCSMLHNGPQMRELWSSVCNIGGLRNHEKSCGGYHCPFQGCNYQSNRRSNVERHKGSCSYHPDKTPNSDDNNQPPVKKLHIINSDFSIDDFTNPELVPNPSYVSYYQARLQKDSEHQIGQRFVDVEFRFTEKAAYKEIWETIDILYRFLENVMYVFLRNTPRYDFVRFTMRCPLFHKPVSMKWVTAEMASVDMLMDAVMRVLNSIEEFSLDAGVIINFQHQRNTIPASGRNELGTPTQRRILDKWSYYLKKKTVIVPNNKDRLCVARCLMIGKKKADHTYWHNYIKSSQLTADAEKVHAISRVPEGPCSLPEIQKFAAHDYFKDYAISVYDAQADCKQTFFSGPKAKTISLLLDSGHCILITRVAGFFGRVYWCQLCDAHYNTEPHKCEESCPMCQRMQCKNRLKEKWAPAFTCSACKTSFTLQQCLECHNEIKACKGKKRCSRCHKLLSAKLFKQDGTHADCGMRYCWTCKKLTDPENHQYCFVEPYIPKKRYP